MIPPKVKAKILTLHRLVGLIAAPVLLLVLISGAVLAFRPILGDQAKGASVDAVALRAAMAAVDPEGATTRVRALPGGKQVVLEKRGRDGASASVVDLATKARVGDAAADPFDVFQRLHRTLLVGVEPVVTVATFALLLLLLAGPFIAWPRRRNTLSGWHTGMGWFLMPILLIAPVTGVMMSLHIGEGERPKGGRKPAITIVSALDAAEKQGVDLHGLSSVSRSGPGVIFATAAGRSMIGADGKPAPIPEPRWTKQLHEGTWGGAISGTLSLAAAAATLAMLVTGVLPWARRKLKQSAKAKKAKAAVA